MTTSWSSIPLTADGKPPRSGDFVKVTSMFRDAVLVWAAGPEHAYRSKIVYEDIPAVRVDRTDRAGVTTTSWEKFDRSTNEQDLIHSNDELNHDLQAAGIPKRTWGFDWYVEVKPGDDLETLRRLLGPTVPILNERKVAEETEKIYAAYIERITRQRN